MITKNNFFLSLIVGLSISIGYLFGKKDSYTPSASEIAHPSIQKLNRLMTYLTEDYVDAINTDSLVRVVIEDVVSALDPHSVYIPAVERQALSESMQGNFEGIGVQFYMVEDSIAVVRVLEGGPSEKAGLQYGDRILMANNDSLYSKQLSTDEIINKLKGPSGTPVELKVYRKRTDSLFTFKLKRGAVPLPSVPSVYMINEKTGYIQINRFSQTTYEEFQSALTRLVDQQMQHLILDLRGNPGGYLLPAKQIADDFLSAGKPIVIVEANNGVRERTVASSNGLFEQGSLYVLVDENSASASEVIAGAIQDNDRGWIVGRRTFGKGLVQQQLPLGEGDQIRLTTSRYYTPTGRSIQRPYDTTTRKDYYAEVQKRYNEGEMEDEEKVPVNDSLSYKTPSGRVVYGGGGIRPDLYLANTKSPEEAWYAYLLRSNWMNQFVFFELDNHFKKYKFDNAAMLLNEPLPYAEEFLSSFKDYCKANNIPMDIDNEEVVLNSIKAFIALQVFDENLYTRIINQKDSFIQRALDAIAAE